MDESVINFVRVQSLQDLRDDPSYTFNQLKISVQTEKNDGTVEHPDTNYRYSQKCFFIACAKALQRKGINTSAYRLMKFSRFDEPHNLVDTDNKNHREKIESLIRAFPHIQLLVYIGRYDPKYREWSVTPDPSAAIGNNNAKIKLRILNMGSHFENITTPDEMFVYAPRTMTPEKVERLQSQLWSDYQ